MRADVLKIGHHGSMNSTTPEFLAAVQPRVGIISAGEDNPYGHPSPELLERLENAGIRILRTDRNGAVQVMTDGRQLEISCFVACPNGGNAAASVQGKAPNRKKDKEKKQKSNAGLPLMIFLERGKREETGGASRQFPAGQARNKYRASGSILTKRWAVARPRI